MTLADRLRQALEAEHDEGPELLAGDFLQLEPGAGIKSAAVLVAVTNRAEPGVILTRRTENLRRHAGEIAFPGGRLDPEDHGPVDAALREAEEEISLPRSQVEVVGTADRYRTISGYDVTPVLGVVPPDLPLVPHEAEVAAVFEAPLRFLLDPANHREGETMLRGRIRHYYEILWGDWRIWGVTAAMIVNLSRRLRWTA